MGGADLECLLACRDLPVSSLLAVLAICEEHGFRMVETDPLLAYGFDPAEPQQISQALQLNEFVAGAELSNARSCIAKLYGTLIDTPTALSVLLDLQKKVVVVSVPEDVLWGFGDDTGRADFEKLRVFAECCKEIASELPAELGYLGTEELHPEDMTPGAEWHGASRVDETFFSEGRLRELFRWYTEVYVKRWQKG